MSFGIDNLCPAHPMQRCLGVLGAFSVSSRGAWGTASGGGPRLGLRAQPAATRTPVGSSGAASPRLGSGTGAVLVSPRSWRRGPGVARTGGLAIPHLLPPIHRGQEPLWARLRRCGVGAAAEKALWVAVMLVACQRGSACLALGRFRWVGTHVGSVAHLVASVAVCYRALVQVASRYYSSDIDAVRYLLAFEREQEGAGVSHPSAGEKFVVRGHNGFLDFLGGVIQSDVVDNALA